LVIYLEDGLTTNAQLTFPIVGEGPFPGVLIIHGSGSTDMDGYIPAELTGTGEPVRHYFLLAEYLTERGFAVLRYNKRGVGLMGLTLDAHAWDFGSPIFGNPGTSLGIQEPGIDI
jgi:hypothetical protein